MKQIVYLILLGGLAAGLHGCDEGNKDQYEEQVVLQGIMYVDRPLQIRLTHTEPMSSPYRPTAVGVSGAVVRVSSGADTFLLEEQPVDTTGGGYYRVADTTMVAVPGVPYSIHVEVGEHILDAQTVGAGRTEFTYQSADSVEYGGTLLTLRWQRDSLAVGYNLLIENLEPDWYNREVSGNNGPGMIPWTSWVLYPHEDSVKVAWVVLNYTGRYRLRLLTCDINLWNYSWTYLPGNVAYEPVSNVRGGLGIFSVADADTTYFTLYDNISDGPNTGG